MKTGNSGRARKAIQIVLAAGMAVGASQQALAGNIFLNIPGIPGESIDDKHKDQIDIESFSPSVERGGDCQLSFTKRVDKATPLGALSLEFVATLATREEAGQALLSSVGRDCDRSHWRALLAAQKVPTWPDQAHCSRSAPALSS